MKIKLTLNECETETLLQLSINHPWRDARIRAAGLLLLGSGEHPTRIAEKLKVSHQSIYNWRYAWEGQGLVGLIGGHTGGRPRLLPPAMVETIIATAAREALTLKRIAERVEAIHCSPLPCSLDTLGKVLKAHGFSFKRTRWSLKKTATPKDFLPVPQNLPD